MPRISLGESSVHIIMDYQRERLPELISVIQPDCALLMSVVSETFSYTLSEMRQLGIPVIATAVGSFRNRIVDGKSGFLCKPESSDISRRLRQLHDNPPLLGSITSSGFAADKQTLDSMSARYDALFPADIKAPLRYSCRQYTLADAQLSEVSASRDDFESRTHQLTLQVDDQQTELHKRAQWAHDLNTQLDDKHAWAVSLQDELIDTRNQFARLETHRLELQQAYEQLDLDNQEKQAGLDHKQRELDELTDRYMSVVNSRSWKLTRPLRYLTRLGHRIAARCAYWFRRGPMLMGRTASSLKTRGLKGTLSRISSELKPQDRFRTDKATVIKSDPLQILEFDVVEHPRVSVVIPVYNQFAHTHQCLSSLLKAENECSFEVIVVDDASSDDTELMLSQFTGINYLRNPENRGFVLTCNRGAAEARGEYVFFLNNDTAVADHWLDRLLDVFSSRADAGLVGSKLIYPDGRLQEAGGIIFNDASGWNYGKFEDPDDPRFNVLHEVDYCSGAAIMIPRDLLDSHWRIRQAIRTGLLRGCGPGLRGAFSWTQGVLPAAVSGHALRRHHLGYRHRFWHQALPGDQSEQVP